MTVYALDSGCYAVGIWLGMVDQLSSIDCCAYTIIHYRPRCTVCGCEVDIDKGPAVRM